MLFAVAVLIYLFLYAPIAVLMFFSFNSANSTQIWEGFSFKWYADLASNQSVLDAFRTSMIVGVSATAIATVIGTLTALALTRHRFRGKSVADSTIYAATVMPEIVVGRQPAGFLRLRAVRARPDHDRRRARGVHDLVRDHRGARPPLGNGPIARGGGPGPRGEPRHTPSCG